MIDLQWQHHILWYGRLFVGRIDRSAGWIAIAMTSVSGTQIGIFSDDEHAKYAVERAVLKALGMTKEDRDATHG